MRLRVAAALAAVAIGLAYVPASAQSLGEVAAREKARRDKEAREGKARPPVKVITDDELRGRVTSGTLSQPAADTTGTPAEGGDATASLQSGAPANPVAPAAAPEKSEDELRAERQAEWRQKLTDAQAKAASLRARRDQMQADLADTKSLYGPNRASIANHLEKTKADLAAAEQEVATLEDTGRRNRYR
jgi:hypothetical protein